MVRRSIRLALIAGTLVALAAGGFGVASARAANTPAELIGNWQLVTLQGAGGAIESTVGAGLTLNFQADDRAGGDGGCNSFGATVTTDDRGRLKFDGLVSTLRACVDETRNQREQRYLSNLRDARGYSLDSNTLRLNFDQLGLQLVFQREGAGGTPGLPNTGGGGMATTTSAVGVIAQVVLVGLLGIGFLLRRRATRIA